MNRKINIAIDGYSSCGKSTIARQLAKDLNYIFIDTGAMYRAITLYFIDNDIDCDNSEAVAEALNNISLDFKLVDGDQFVTLNDQWVEDKIRSLEVSNRVSEVAALSPVRRFLVKQQQQIARPKGIVMDGRDIGTVVMPDAELKLFVIADKEVRIQRRYDELCAKGLYVSREEVRRNLEYRDHVDTHRQDSPLTKAEDALILDNTHLSPAEQRDWVLKEVEKRLN